MYNLVKLFKIQDVKAKNQYIVTKNKLEKIFVAVME